MDLEISMPQLGESVTEGLINKWLVKPGDRVERDDPLCEVLTEKVNAEIPASQAGVVKDIAAAEGDIVPVGHRLCTLVTDEDSQVNGIEADDAPRPEETQKPRYSPVVLRLADEHQLDLASISGTGMGGRVTRKDVLAVIEGAPQTEATAEPAVEPSAPSTPSTPASENLPVPDENREQRVEHRTVDPIRRMIAERMVRSATTIPHAWTVMEADVTDLVAFRQKVKNRFFNQEGVRLTYFPFFVQAVIKGLQEYDQLNASWHQEHIHQHRDVHVSLAVATDKGLLVPVIHQANRLSLTGLVHAIDSQIKKARAGKLTPDDVSGGTFTVNNTGAFGSVISMPIINPPQSGIVTMEAIVKRPVVIDDMIAIRSMVNLCFSFDHRIVDGAVAGQFLQSVCRHLQVMARETSF